MIVMDVFLFKDICLLHTFIGRAKGSLFGNVEIFYDVYRVDESEMGGYVLRDIDGCMCGTSIDVSRVACYEQLDRDSDIYSSYLRLLEDRYVVEETD